MTGTRGNRGCLQSVAALGQRPLSTGGFRWQNHGLVGADSCAGRANRSSRTKAQLGCAMHAAMGCGNAAEGLSTDEHEQVYEA
jgi:hypothetical protein